MSFVSPHLLCKRYYSSDCIVLRILCNDCTKTAHPPANHLLHWIHVDWTPYTSDYECTVFVHLYNTCTLYIRPPIIDCIGFLDPCRLDSIHLRLLYSISKRPVSMACPPLLSPFQGYCPFPLSHLHTAKNTTGKVSSGCIQFLAGDK